MVDLHLTKEWIYGDNSFLLGARGRYKRFDIDKFSVDGTNVPITSAYDTDFISSIYAENEYMLSQNSMIIASLKFDDYYRNGGVKNENPIGGRLGYIYNKENYYLKSFLFYGELPPEPYIIASNKRTNSSDADMEKAYSASAEFGYETKKYKTFITI